MNRSDFLLEIGTEEIPASFINPALKQLKERFAKELNDTRIDYLDIKTYGTCRRQIVYIRELVDKQRERDIEIIGPPKNKAFDESGKPTQIGIGFAKSHEVDIRLFKVKKTPKGEYIYISKREKTNKTSAILSAIIPNIITSVEFPKSMRWYDNIRFARPIRWILALYGNDTIKFNVSDVSSDNFTYCHRFRSSGKKKVLKAEDYFKIVKKGFCIVSQSERKNIIKEKAGKLAESIGGKLSSDEKLLEELTCLVEYPEAVLCEFDKNFLKLSADIPVQVMKQQQKYIPVIGEDGELLEFFILVTNGIKNKNIKENNEKVLKARFKDAEFFYNEDTKSSFYSKVNKLNKVVWQEHLGTLKDKTDRLSKLVKILADELRLDYDTQKILKKATELSKVDLVTELVREFPELQGIVGRMYVLRDEELKKELSYEKLRGVAYAIEEQYLPRYFGDTYVLPKTQAGIMLSIAEKIDNITGCFINDLIPTGSTDPYGLKRQAIGLINTVLAANNLNFSLRRIFKLSIELLIDNLNKDREALLTQILDFINDRFENILLEKKIKYDSVRAVFSADFDSILDANLRVIALENLRNMDNFNEIITVFTRVINILPKKKEEYKNISLNVSEEILVEDGEKKLWQNFLEIKLKVDELFAKRDFEGGFKEMSKLQIDVNSFFDKVMVMVDDEKIKNNRLAILKNINELFLKFADFSKLVFS